MAKKRHKKSGTSKGRQAKKYGGPGSTRAESDAATGGVMQNMVGGFRRAVGAEKSKKRGLGDLFWTIALLMVLGAVLYWRFG